MIDETDGPQMEEWPLEYLRSKLEEHASAAGTPQYTASLLLETCCRLDAMATDAERIAELEEEAEAFDERADELEQEARRYADQRAHEAHLATEAANARARRAEDDARHAQMMAEGNARRERGR